VHNFKREAGKKEGAVGGGLYMEKLKGASSGSAVRRGAMRGNGRAV
jgi:hypothetical protein